MVFVYFTETLLIDFRRQALGQGERQVGMLLGRGAELAIQIPLGQILQASNPAGPRIARTQYSITSC